MSNPIARYYHWLHGRWPAGTVEALPEVGEDGATKGPGIRIVGDLSGIPLLKFSSDTGARAVHAILAESDFQGARAGDDGGAEVDVAIVGGGISGVSAAIEAKKAGLSYVLFEAGEVFSTIVNFPVGKPIYTYPTEMEPAGGIQYGESSDTRESLLDDVRAQAAEHEIEATPERVERVERTGGLVHVHRAGGEVTRARRCIIAIGRSGNYRKLGVPGEELDKVSNRLHDPKDCAGKDVLVVGGGDSAAEAAIALAESGARVTLSYRKAELTRPKPENVARVEALAESGDVDLALGTEVTEISDDAVSLDDGRRLPNDAVFAMIGREAPLDFFRRSGIRIAGERNRKWWITAALSLLFFLCLYGWTKGDPNLDAAGVGGWVWPDKMDAVVAGLGGWWEAKVADRSSLVGTVAVSLKSRSFYYTLTYCLLVAIFGIRRIRRRRTPYVTRQTVTLGLIQWLPLFILPEIVFPFLGYNGLFPHGSWADGVFEPYIGAAQYAAGAWPDWGHPRAYWRAYGFILAWPLFVYNLFTENPMWFWVVVCLLQTFVLIPWMIRRWGKGAYCGWICSCGALAETVGDRHRHKMPHGPAWTRLNMVGQVFLAAAFALLFLRVLSWAIPGNDALGWFFKSAFEYIKYGGEGKSANYLSYSYVVDILFAGALGVAFYFHLSGRVWCRFACPLAALMHVYARFSKFRIFADKKKCISCNVCTSVCHQGIDIMNFANKGAPMEDPECVRCSACVQQCPTGVLSFGRYGSSEEEIVLDKLPASSVRMEEEGTNGG